MVYSKELKSVRHLNPAEIIGLSWLLAQDFLIRGLPKCIIGQINLTSPCVHSRDNNNKLPFVDTFINIYRVLMK